MPVMVMLNVIMASDGMLNAMAPFDRHCKNNLFSGSSPIEPQRVNLKAKQLQFQ
jgi:hypothetical protein